MLSKNKQDSKKMNISVCGICLLIRTNTTYGKMRKKNSGDSKPIDRPVGLEKKLGEISCLLV